MMPARALPARLVLLLVPALLAGCFSRGSLEERCREAEAREYQRSRDIAGLEVPEDLVEPEAPGVVIPDVAQVESDIPPACLELPPDYFGRDRGAAAAPAESAPEEDAPAAD